MIRIRVHEAEEQLTIQVEGQLAGIFTNELERCWRCTDAGTYGKVVLDLDGVIHIDRAGRDLLRSMHRNGVRFAGPDWQCRMFWTRLWKLTGQTQCRRNLTGSKPLPSASVIRKRNNETE